MNNKNMIDDKVKNVISIIKDMENEVWVIQNQKSQIQKLI